MSGTVIPSKIPRETAAQLDPFIGLTKIKQNIRRIFTFLGFNTTLPVYASNAAAITGGLTPGDSYVTSAGSFMIVQTP